MLSPFFSEIRLIYLAGAGRQSPFILRNKEITLSKYDNQTQDEDMPQRQP